MNRYKSGATVSHYRQDFLPTLILFYTYSIVIMRAMSLVAFVLAAVTSIDATSIRRDGCDGLSGTDNVSNFKLVSVRRQGDAVIKSPLAVIPDPPSLLLSWIAVRS